MNVYLRRLLHTHHRITLTHTNACGKHPHWWGQWEGGLGRKGGRAWLQGAQQVMSPQLVGLAPPQNFLALMPKPKAARHPGVCACVFTLGVPVCVMQLMRPMGKHSRIQ